MPPDVSADDSGHSRREFLGRTAYAAGLAGVTGLSADTILSEAAQATTRFSPLPKPRNVPIDHFVLLMMENRSFDHYFGWLRGYADGDQNQATRTPRASWSARATPRRSGSGGVEYKGCGHPDPGHGWNSGRAQLTAASSPRAAATTSSRSATTTAASSASSTRRRATTRSTTATSARCSPAPGRTATTSGRRSRAGSRRTRSQPGGNSWETIFDRALAHGLTRELLLLGPALRAALGPRAPRPDRTDHAVLRGLRGRQAAEHRDRRPALQATAAAATGSPRTSTRSATSASARRSRPTW